jgi:hypothetical protein
MKILHPVIILFLGIGLSWLSLSTVSGQTSTTEQRQVPMSAIYRLWLHQVASVKKQSELQADEKKKARNSSQSVEVSGFREADKKGARFSEKQMKAVERFALNFQYQLDLVNKRMAQIVKEFRAANKIGVNRPTDPLPPPPAELIELQKQKEELSARAIEGLRILLGEEAFRTLDNYIRNDVANKITVQNIGEGARGININRTPPVPTMQRELDTNTGKQKRVSE